jgi:hypothetical protein
VEKQLDPRGAGGAAGAVRSKKAFEPKGVNVLRFKSGMGYSKLSCPLDGYVSLAHALSHPGKLPLLLLPRHEAGSPGPHAHRCASRRDVCNRGKKRSYRPV